MRRLRWLLTLFLLSTVAGSAQIVGSLPYNLQNNTVADATQVMANFNTILSSINANGAKNGVNTDITQLSNLTTPLLRSQGGTSTYIATAVGGGSANAQTVAATSPAFVLATGVVVQYVPGFTNTGSATLNVGGSGGVNVFRPTSSGPVALSGGELVAGSVTFLIYDGTQYDLLTDYTSSVPPSSVFYTAGAAAPSGYVLLQGQAISRAVYSALFSVIGTTYGAGDGFTTFNVPDARGRQFYSVDGGTGRISGCGVGGALASTCGSQIFAQASLPNVNFAVSGTVSITPAGVAGGQSSASLGSSGVANAVTAPAVLGASFNLVAASGGLGSPYSPPAIVLTAIMKY